MAAQAERWKREVSVLRRESGELVVKLTKAEMENCGLHRALDSCQRDIRALQLRVASLSAYQHQQGEAYGYRMPPPPSPPPPGAPASPAPAPGLDRVGLQAQVDDLSAQLAESGAEVRRLKARLLKAQTSGGQRVNADLSARLESICEEKIEVEQRLASAQYDLNQLRDALRRAQSEQRGGEGGAGLSRRAGELEAHLAAALEGNRVLGALLTARDLEARALAAHCDELRERLAEAGQPAAPSPDAPARHLCPGCQGRLAAAAAAAASTPSPPAHPVPAAHPPPIAATPPHAHTPGPAGLAAGWDSPRPPAASSPQLGSLPFSPLGTALGGASSALGPFSLSSPLRSPPASPLRQGSAGASPFFTGLGGSNPFSIAFSHGDAKAVGGGSPGEKANRNPAAPS